MALCNQNKTVLEFMVYGEGFPLGRNDGWFAFKSNEDQFMTVNYNDGTQPVKYPMNANHYTKLMVSDYPNEVMDEYEAPPIGADLKYKGRVFDDRKTGDRIVRISFDNPSSILEVSHYLVYNWKGTYPVNILKYTNITTFSIGYAHNLEDLPEDLITLKNIEKLEISNSFDISKYFKYEIPLGFFNLSLTSLGLTGMYLGDVFKDGKTGNLNYLHLLKDKLRIFKINNCFIEDVIIPQSVIDSILLCEEIDHLYIDTNKLTAPPSFINQMNQLRLLYIGGGVDWDYYMTDWGDLSNLTNLQSLYCPVASNAPTDIPPYIKDFPNLVRFYVNGSYDSQERWDEFIENLYNYTLLFAPIANDDINNPVGARNYEVSNNRTSATYVVTGEYEQPFGYEQGVSNGEANTQLQKIWVLKNQYNVNVIYKDNRALDGGN